MKRTLTIVEAGKLFISKLLILFNCILYSRATKPILTKQIFSKSLIVLLYNDIIIMEMCIIFFKLT